MLVISNYNLLLLTTTTNYYTFYYYYYYYYYYYSKNTFKGRFVVGWRMQYELIGAICLIIVNIWVTISLFKSLTEHIEALFTEMVEDLPPALGEAMQGSMGELAGMAEINPIQAAIAQLIPQLIQPNLEVKEISRDPGGKFSSDNL